MVEAGPTSAGYLGAVASLLSGSRRTRTRLLREIGDHLDDALAANLAAGMEEPEAAARAVASLGSASALVEAWEARCVRLRGRRRRRSAMLIAAATAASVLAAAQHAQGRREPASARACAVAHRVSAGWQCGQTQTPSPSGPAHAANG